MLSSTLCKWIALNVCKKRKRIGNSNTGSENIQSRHRDWIWHRKMSHANNKRWKTTNDEKNRTAKSRKNQNARRKGNLQIFWNIGSGHHQTLKKRKEKIILPVNKKNFSKSNYIAEISWKGKMPRLSPPKIVMTIFDTDQRTWKNELWRCIKLYILEMT